jgi:hypothetical protein
MHAYVELTRYAWPQTFALLKYFVVAELQQYFMHSL